ncbi:hypothetical protein KBB12_02205 [Candidatus Woesebacteria bacterium]|nr:hypothetical protein [Candidatus Woesebacteria bacterium]
MIIELSKRKLDSAASKPPFKAQGAKVIPFTPCRWPEDHNLLLIHPINRVNIYDPGRLVEVADAMEAVQECPWRTPVPGSQGCVYACEFGGPRKRGGGCPNENVTSCTDTVLK